MLYPVVNINGSNPADLVDTLIEAHYHLCRAIEMLNEAAPHGRDYPCGGIFEAAREHELKVRAVMAVRDYAFDVASNICDQRDARAARKVA